MRSRDGEAKATLFQAMHRQGPGFVMPNAWDAGGALVLVAAGFKAIGTTSAGIAFSLGKQDYNVTCPALAVSRDEMFARMCEIAQAVPVPVNGDLEAGYGNSLDAVAETVNMALRAGLAGGNIEDRNPVDGVLYDDVLAAERIAAARAAIGGRDFVLNARTDAFQLMGEEALSVAIYRANRFLEAGADCVFVPGVADISTMKVLVREIDGPVNVVAGLASNEGSAFEMIEAGITRVSLGGSIARSALGFIRECARELAEQGTFGFASGQMPQPEINALFAAIRAR